MTQRPIRRLAGLAALAAAAAAGPARGQEIPPAPLTFGTYGTTALIDMPTAQMAPDATLSTTFSEFAGTLKTTLSFQITPRLSGSFRYTAIEGLEVPGYTRDTYYDRSFDLRYQVLTEGKWRPAVAVGLRDFIGTGLYGSEYVVATKEIVPGLRFSGGLGWGRLGSYESFGSTGTRPEELLGEGGIPTYDRWFRGDVAAFGGLSFAVTDRLTVKAEYSSDAYEDEVASGVFDRESPWNYGIDYQFKNGTQLSVYSLYGTEIGAQISFHLNPRKAPYPGGRETAPVPVSPRASLSAEALGWTGGPERVKTAKQGVAQALARENLTYEALRLTGRTATLRLRNDTYGSVAQAVGRAARVLTRTLPPSVDTFEIVPVVDGMAMSRVTLDRGDLERLENDAAAEMLARTEIVDGFGAAPRPEAGLYPRFTYGIAPYIAISTFDPDNPARADLGARVSARAEITPNLILSGSVTKKLTGNLDETTNEVESELPRVRTDVAEYSKEGDPALERLQLAAYGRLGKNVYGRLTAGYLERMFAGVSGEVLWKPVDSRLALGAELNYVKQRDFDQGFGLRDYDVVMGHASAYYDFGNGFHGQLDVGRYLAGDYGATVSLDREFANGWRVGAYATFTDVEFEDFGEGSFDKGIRVRIPLSWALGRPTQQSNTINIRSLSRDGGAQLDVEGRLYERVRDYHSPEIAETWGRFWR